MLDDIPDDITDDEIDWPDDWDATERVRALADTITHRRTVEEIADLAGVDEETAQRVLEECEDRDPHLTFEDGEYRRTDLNR